MKGISVKRILMFVLWMLFTYQAAAGLVRSLDGSTIGGVVRNMLPAILLGALIVFVFVLQDIRPSGLLRGESPIITVKHAILLVVASLPLSALIVSIGERGLIDLGIVFALIGSFFLAIYFMISGKETSAVITFLLAFPFLSLIEQWFSYVPLILVLGPMTLTPTIAFLLTIFFLSLLPRRAKKSKHSLPVLLTWSLLIFLVISVISSTLSVDPLKSLQSLYLEYVCPAILFITILKNTEGDKEIKALAYALLISGVLVSFNALYFFGRYFDAFVSNITDLDSALLAGNFSAGSWMNMVVMVLPLAIILSVLQTKKRVSIIFFGPTILFLLISTAVSFVRTAILSTAVSLAALMVARKTRRVVLIILAISAIGLIANQPFLRTYMGFRYANVDSPADIINDSSLLHRVDAWEAALKMIRDHPLFGIGTGLWDEYIPRYGNTQPVVVALHPIRYRLGYINSPHNYYVQLAVSSGLPGLLAWLCFMVSVFREGIRTLLSSRNDDLRFYLVLGAMAGLLAYLTWCLLGGAFAERVFLGVGFYFFSLVAIVVKLSAPRTINDKGPQRMPYGFNRVTIQGTKKDGPIEGVGLAHRRKA